VGPFLDSAQQQGDAVASQHSLEHDVGSDPEENFGDGLVGHAQGLERTDCGYVPEQHYKQT